MIDNQLLEELVTFSELGTLTQTAAALHINQSSVTRGLQRLEEEYGVPLFDRAPNRITLNETGQLAAERAAAVLAAQKQMVTEVQNFARAQHQLVIAAALPGPLILARRLPALQAPSVEIADTILPATQEVAALELRTAALIFTAEEIHTETIDAQFVGVEALFANLDQFTYQASQAAVTFADLAGLSFVVMPGIGVWGDVVRAHIPGAKFLYQEEQAAFAEITRYSNFPFFSTNLSGLDPHFADRVGTPGDRRTVPIKDAAAQMPIYACYLKENRSAVAPLIDAMRAGWPAV